MFGSIYFFEIRQGLRKPATYLFAAFMLALSMLLAMIATGVISTLESDSLVTVNSAHSIADYLIATNADALGLINSIILISVIATGVQKDYQYQMHPFFFTAPITKSAYFFGRFFGGFTLAVFIFLCSLLGLFVGFAMGYGHPSLGPFKVWNFLQPFLIFVLPNIFLQGIIYFALTTFLRNTLVSYLVAILIVVIQFAAQLLTADMDNKSIATLLEPSGRTAFLHATEYWTAAQKNSNLIPFKEDILYNRLLWLGMACIITLWSYWRFSFSQYLQPLNWWRRNTQESVLIVNKYESLADIPQPKIRHGFIPQISRFFYLAWYELRKIIQSPFYIIICILGLAITLLVFMFSATWNDAETYPLTYRIIEQIRGGFYLVLIIFSVFYTGTAVWKEKEYKMDELLGVTFIRNSTLYFARFAGVWFSIGIILLISILTGISLQIYEGFWQIDLLQYAIYFAESMVSFGIITLLCIAVQTLFSNKYIGYFVSLIPILFVAIILNALRIENPLLYFNSSGASLPYSDMNGYGGKFFVWSWYKSYWLAFVLALSALALMVFFRGKEKQFFSRFRLNSENLSKNLTALFAMLIIVVGAGWYISKENKKLNAGLTAKQKEQIQIDYEKQYKQFASSPQPRIYAVFAEVDIFPSKQAMNAQVRYTLVNNTASIIDTLLINYNGKAAPQFNYKKIAPNVASTIIDDNKKIGVRIIKLDKGLAPGDSIEVTMNLEYKQTSAFSNQETAILHNGTFFNNQYFISFGYNSQVESTNNSFRKKNNLEAKDRTNALEDTLAQQNNYIAHDADWIDFECIISTEPDQMAIAPGYLQKKWTNGDRLYFHYKMDSPILNFYAFQSARYEVAIDRWNDVAIEIYHHPGHDYNVAEMISSIKASLAYYSQAFGPYQHRQIRIIEFPRYAGFAQSFPNTIPYSEEVGFTTKSPENTDEINMPFYITAHEVAHQWWAHQVVGANMQGSEMLSESLSQYSALMVMEKEYGRSAMKRFLRHELNDYLTSRTFETKREVPLARVERQGYIYYNKGSLVFYALRDYLGEENLNKAIRKYLDRYKFQGPPYSRSLDLIECIREITPDSLAHIVADLFDHITLYESYVKDLSLKTLADGRYEVTVSIGIAKFYADESGKEIRAPWHTEYVDLGIFASDKDGKEQELLLTKITMDEAEKTLSFVVDKKPESVGVDPYYKLIDRRISNNLVKFGSKPDAPQLNEEKTINLPLSK